MFEKIKNYIADQKEKDKETLKKGLVYGIIFFFSFMLARTASGILIDLYYSFREKLSVEDTLVFLYSFGFMLSTYGILSEHLSEQYQSYLSSKQKQNGWSQ